MLIVFRLTPGVLRLSTRGFHLFFSDSGFARSLFAERICRQYKFFAISCYSNYFNQKELSLPYVSILNKQQINSKSKNFLKLLGILIAMMAVQGISDRHQGDFLLEVTWKMSYQNISAELSEEDLQIVNTALATILDRLPFLVNLTPEERHDLFKMGDKSLAFVSKGIQVAERNQNILPSSFDLPEFTRDFELSQALHDILSQLHQLTEKVDDTLLAVGSEAMRSSLSVYDYVKAAAKHQPGLKSVSDQLGERFKAIGQTRRRNRNMPAVE
jgi:hypothetical protein